MSTYAHITGWGMAVPDMIRTNDDLKEFIETNDEWIRERTGIHQRRIAAPEDTTASLGAKAALNALAIANIAPSDIDLVICTSSSPEYIFPATASLIQDRIGATNAGAFDISAACTGFILAVNMASQAIRSGSIKSAIVVGSEVLSRFVDWSDRTTCILFGDGAGAFVLQASEEPGGVISSVMRSDGSGGDLLWIPAGGSTQPASATTIESGKHYVQMNGREVYRFATRVMAQASKDVIAKAEWKIEDVDLIIPHQANKRIIDAAAKGLKLPEEKFMVNLHNYGNTSTASIPIATVEAFEQGRLKRNDKIVIVGFGGGLSWGGATVIWTGPFPSDKPVNLERHTLIARIRSWLRRIGRTIEGLIWGRKNQLRK